MIRWLGVIVMVVLFFGGLGGIVYADVLGQMILARDTMTDDIANPAATSGDVVNFTNYNKAIVYISVDPTSPQSSWVVTPMFYNKTLARESTGWIQGVSKTVNTSDVSVLDVLYNPNVYFKINGGTGPGIAGGGRCRIWVQGVRENFSQ